MRIERLENIADIQIGKTPKRDNIEWWGKGNLWVSISDLKGKYITQTKEEITDKAILETGCKLIPKGTILLSFKLSIGKVAFAGENLYTNEAICGLLLKDSKSIYPDYLYYALLSTKFLGSNVAAKGSTMNTASLKNIKIPLPDKYEDQIRIATLLSKAEALIKQRKESIDLLDEYLKSTFLEMFGDPVKNEKKFSVARIDDISTDIKDGPHVSPNYVSEGVPILSTRNIRPGELVLDDVKYVSQEVYSDLTKRFKPQKNDILVTKGGTTGYAKVVDFDFDFCVWVHIAVIRPKPSVLPIYLEHFINSDFGYSQTQRYTRGIANRDLGLKRIATIELLLPPIQLQKHFSYIAEKVKELKKQYKSSLAELENLYGSLSQKAFKGELILEEIDDVSDMNSVIKEAVKYARTIQEHYKTIQDISQIGDSFKNDVDSWNKLIVPIQNLTNLPKEILKTQELLRSLQTNIAIVNPAIENALQLAKTLNENYIRFKDVSLLSKSFQNQIVNWNKAFEPIKNLTVLPEEIIDFQRKIEMLQSPKLKVFIDEKKKQRKLIWGNISFKQIAEIIIETYSEHYFNNEMLVKYMIDEQVIFPNYYSSKQLKKSPKLNESDDYKSFIFTALRNENPFFKLEQFFYDGIDANFLLKLREEDYDSSKSPKDYSGIYFKIIE